MGANWLCWISLRPVDVILPSAHQLLNWSAFWRILGDLGSIPELSAHQLLNCPRRDGLEKLHSSARP